MVIKRLLRSVRRCNCHILAMQSRASRIDRKKRRNKVESVRPYNSPVLVRVKGQPPPTQPADTDVH
ncbi:hypothetical protein J6590_089663 [Homalodisca vitripennis]|nr:hypothetical protein J6590_089663 [Homalodisca vitripennis]